MTADFSNKPNRLSSILSKGNGSDWLCFTTMNNLHRNLIPLGILASLPALLQGAEITWGVPFSIAVTEDISNPAGSIIHEALDFNAGAGLTAGDDLTINGILFTTSAAAGTGNISTNMTNGPAYGAAFSPVASSDADLDSLLDSHAYSAENPIEVSVTINNLTPGTLYQIQLIGVGDDRACCAARTYEPDNGLGVYNTGIQIARGDIGGSRIHYDWVPRNGRGRCGC